MSESIQSLWPEQVRQRAQSPRQILRTQATALGLQTGGILLGEIKYKEREDETVTLDFDVVVPALDGYRHRLFSVAYKKEFPYPAMVNAPIFGSNGRTFLSRFMESGGITRSAANCAENDHDLMSLIGQVLHSPQVISAVQSLLARASDALDDMEHPDPSISQAESASIDEQGLELD